MNFMIKFNFLLRLVFINLIFVITSNCYAFPFNQHIYALDCNQRSTAVGWFQITDSKIEKISFQNGNFFAHVSSSNFSVGSSLGSLLANYGSYTELYRFENDQAQVAFRYTSPDNYTINNRKIVSSGADVPKLFKCPQNSVAYLMVSDDANKRFLKSSPQTAQSTIPPKQYQSAVIGSQAANIYRSCQEFIQSFKDHYSGGIAKNNFYSQYKSYFCEQSTNTSGIPYFVINGRPGTNSTESFILLNGSNCIFNEHSNGVNKVFQVRTWDQIGAKQSDPDIQKLCISNFTGGDKESHLLKYDSNLGNCNSTLKLIPKTDRDNQKLDLAKLAIRQGCNDEKINRYVYLLETKLNDERLAQEAKNKETQELCAARQRSCQKITNIDTRLREEIARSISVSPASVNFQRVELNSCGCDVVVYTPKGPLKCTNYGFGYQCN